MAKPLGYCGAIVNRWQLSTVGLDSRLLARGLGLLGQLIPSPWSWGQASARVTETGQGVTRFLQFMVVLRLKTSVSLSPMGSPWSKQASATACTSCPFGTELVSVFVSFSNVSELLTSRNWVLCIFF